MRACRIGYLHRDIKPSNYAIGRKEVNDQRCVYILDFGMCRRFKTDDGNKSRIRTPRDKVSARARACLTVRAGTQAGFRGTVRYAPLCCHNQVEQSAKDDMESWFYQQIEMTKGALPWRTVRDKDETGRMKQAARAQSDIRRQMFHGCPLEYEQIFDHLNGLGYYDYPNYNLIRQVRARIHTSIRAHLYRSCLKSRRHAASPTRNRTIGRCPASNACPYRGRPRGRRRRHARCRTHWPASAASASLAVDARVHSLFVFYANAFCLTVICSCSSNAWSFRLLLINEMRFVMCNTHDHVPVAWHPIHIHVANPPLCPK